MLSRRQFIRHTAGLGAGLAGSRLLGRRAWAEPAALPFGNG
jgi:hypothetical protein